MVRQRTNGVETTDDGIQSGDTPVIITDAGGVEPLEDSGGIPTVEPSSLTFEAEQFEGGKRRGRPRGSKNSAGKSPTKEVQQDLSSLLYSLHLMGSALLKTPELELTVEESEKLGKAVARVNAEYGNIILDPKTAALLNLGIVGVTIYGPRIITVRNNKKKKKEAAPATVH